VAVVGTSCSSEARAGAPILSDAGFTMVSPSATAPDLTDPAKHVPGFLRTAHNDKVQGQVAAQFVAEELKLKTVATIHDGSPYAEGLVNAFTENFTGMGGTISAAEAVGPTDTDMRPVLTKIAAGKPEMLYYPIFTASGGLVTVQSEEIEGLGPEIKTMGADGLFSPDFLKASGASALGMYLSSPDFSTFGTDYSEKFLPAYEAAYGEKPTSAFHAHAYDAVNVIVAAINAVGVKNDDGSLTIGRKALRDALYATKDFKGLTGNISCGENGDCADPKIAVYEITQENLDAGEVPTARIYPK
jgi:branched-chain amino acid transport system substrate-binding protein